MTTQTRPAAPSPADLAVRSLFTDPAAAADPYPVYRVLRETAPVHRSITGHWVLSRHADIDAVLRSPGVGKNVEAFIAGQQVPDWRSHESFTRMLDHLIWLNPPRHTRLRGLLGSVLTPRAVTAYEPQITQRVGELLDPLAGGGDVDLLDELAFPLPVAVIGTMLGVPSADWPSFRRLVREVTLCVEPSPTGEQLAIADAAARELNGYFDALIAERRANPRDDMISTLVAAEIDGERLTEGELSSLVQFLFGAGFETTTNLIGNGTLALLRQPEQLELLRADPSLIGGAVEELLRFDASVQLTMRTAFDDLVVDDHVVPAGESMLLLLGAANRDPARYPDPDRLDVTRTAVRPLSFSAGIHFCLGAALARLEGRVAFTELLRRFRGIELLDPSPRWKSNLTLHGLEELPVRLIPA
jgi:cytochrome P450